MEIISFISFSKIKKRLSVLKMLKCAKNCSGTFGGKIPKVITYYLQQFLVAGFLLLCDVLYRDLIMPVAFMQIMQADLIMPAAFMQMLQAELIMNAPFCRLCQLN